MVLAGCRREEVVRQEEPNKKKSGMAMGPERSRSLHNFSLPCLRWGSRRQLRCVKPDRDGGSNSGGGSDHFPALDRRSPASSSKSTYHHHHHNHHQESARFSRKPPLGPERKRRSLFDTDSGKRSTTLRDQNYSENGRKSSSLYSAADDNNGIEAMRKKLVLDLQTEMDKMKSAVLNNGNSNSNSKKKEEEIVKPPPVPPKTTDSAAEARPWNLRTRRAVCKEPNGNGGGLKELRIDERKSNSGGGGAKSPARRRSDGGVGGEYVGEKRPRPKFSVALSKQEIEEDFIAITGTRPPKRPKKRPRVVQKQVDAVFPGLWLTEITADMYKVNENPEAGKR